MDSAGKSLQTKKFIDIDWERLLLKYKAPILMLLIGAILVGFGTFMFKDGVFPSSSEIEVLESTSESESTNKIVVEVAGVVENPGVYKFSGDARVEDLLISAGGFSEDVDRDWTDRFINHAAKLIDGQKFYIFRKLMSKRRY